MVPFSLPSLLTQLHKTGWCRRPSHQSYIHDCEFVYALLNREALSEFGPTVVRGEVGVSQAAGISVFQYPGIGWTARILSYLQELVGSPGSCQDSRYRCSESGCLGRHNVDQLHLSTVEQLAANAPMRSAGACLPLQLSMLGRQCGQRYITKATPCRELLTDKSIGFTQVVVLFRPPSIPWYL